MNGADAGHRRRIRLSGAGFVLLSMLSVVLSLGAPGLGWSLATVTMIAVGLCARLVGQCWLWMCLGVTLLHLVTFGPLTGAPGSSFGSDRIVGAVVAALPFLAGAAAFLATHRRRRK